MTNHDKINVYLIVFCVQGTGDEPCGYCRAEDFDAIIDNVGNEGTVEFYSMAEKVNCVVPLKNVAMVYYDKLKISQDDERLLMRFR